MKIVLLLVGISLGFLVTVGLIMLLKDMQYYRRIERDAAETRKVNEIDDHDRDVH